MSQERIIKNKFEWSFFVGCKTKVRLNQKFTKKKYIFQGHWFYPAHNPWGILWRFRTRE